ncbi:MAG: YraN family protein [Clostridia bacterium]|nr:YraN family protein [Clostridia bacterium]MBQ9919628.1 YraN family protein [Clostridia bacterium]
MNKLNNAMGKAGENLAVEFLREKGFFISARNFRSSRGEIDIIAENRELVLFVEVKLRRADAGYMPREAVTADKRNRLLHAAKSFIYRSKATQNPRFDIIEIITNERQDLKDADINWIENAF